MIDRNGKVINPNYEEIKYQMNGSTCLTPCPYNKHLSSSRCVNSGACKFCKHYIATYDRTNTVFCHFVADTKKKEIVGYDAGDIVVLNEPTDGNAIGKIIDYVGNHRYLIEICGYNGTVRMAKNWNEFRSLSDIKQDEPKFKDNEPVVIPEYFNHNRLGKIWKYMGNGEYMIKYYKDGLTTISVAELSEKELSHTSHLLYSLLEKVVHIHKMLDDGGCEIYWNDRGTKFFYTIQMYELVRYEEKWTPKNGEKIQAKMDEASNWFDVTFIGMHNNKYICHTPEWVQPYSYWDKIRPKETTMTIKEIEEKIGIKNLKIVKEN